MRVIIKILAAQLGLLHILCQAQQTSVVLDQGTVMGLKIFPDSSRIAVYAFLGLPYAQPPIGDLRFSPPRPHNGWNWTLQAMSMKSVCPQLTNTIYDESTDGTLARPTPMDEDCLYLNIWVPEAGMRFGQLPVLVIITGEEMSYDWPRNRATGLDFASEGTVVVSVQYRSNIFGWISLGNQELAGNYGFQDQGLALKWIKYNIKNFGGDLSKITLLGHGTTGAPCALLHALTYATHEQFFSKIILMSGGDVEAALNSHSGVRQASQVLVQKLGCQFEERGNQVVSCLRMKSVSDLQKAFESVYDHGNGTLTLGPDMPLDVKELLSNKTVLRSLPPLLIGITSNEAAFLQDYWLDLAREGYQALRSYVNHTVLPSVLRKLAITAGAAQITDALNWRYFSGEAAVNVGHLLNAMQRLLSETFHETPFYRILEFLNTKYGSDPATTTYAYIFEMANSMDMRGKVNLFGGSSHSSDLPLLLGPSLFQQISRRRFTPNEERLCRKIRAAFVNFIRSGDPTPGRVYDAWLPYGSDHKFIFNLGEAVEKSSDTAFIASTTFEKNNPKIEKLLETDQLNNVGLSRPNRNEYRNPYQTTIGQAVIDSRSSKSASYFASTQDSGYALHLKRVNGFWQVLIPNMLAYGSDGNYDDFNNALSQRARLMEATADAVRYKQGFFAMLGLVSALLAILGLCVYLLRRDPLRMSSPMSDYCL